MEDDLNLFCKWKTTSNLFCKWKMTSIYFLMEDDLSLFSNGRRPQFILLMEDDLVNGLALLA
jgi:hypothetical protein